jgi:hypothetical protein
LRWERGTAAGLVLLTILPAVAAPADRMVRYP